MSVCIGSGGSTASSIAAVLCLVVPVDPMRRGTNQFKATASGRGFEDERAMKTERLSLDCLVAAYAMGVCQVGRETIYRKQKLKLYQLRSAFLRANGQRFGKSEANVDRKQNYGARPVISKVPWLNLVGKNRLFWMRLAKKHELQPSSAQRAGC